MTFTNTQNNYMQLVIQHPGTFEKTKGNKLSIESHLGTCQKLAGGRGVETEGGSQLFETAEKGGVMKNGPLKYVSDHPQKKKEVLYFVKKTWEKQEN